MYGQVTPKFVNSLVELITSSIDNIASPDVHPSQRAPPGLLEGVQTPEMITRHFRNTLLYIQTKKAAAAADAAAKQRGRKRISKRASAAQPVGHRSVHVKCEEVDQTLSLSPLTGVEVAVPFGERVGLLKSEDSD